MEGGKAPRARIFKAELEGNVIKIKQKRRNSASILVATLSGLYRMFPGFIVPFITQNKSILNVKACDFLEQSRVTNPGSQELEKAREIDKIIKMSLWS